MQPVEELANGELVAEFVTLAKRAKLSQELAAQLTGVRQSTASEWWRKIYRDLQPDTRRALEDVVRTVREGGDVRSLLPDATQTDLAGRSGEEREAWKCANAILDPILRIAEREAIAATVRAEALRCAARAMERGESASLARAQLISEAGDERRAKRAQVIPSKPLTDDDEGKRSA